MTARKAPSPASNARCKPASASPPVPTPAGPPPGTVFVAREVELMVENGMTPEDALEASTRVAADLLGIQDQAGTIEVGKQADMVLIDGGPTVRPGRAQKHLGRVPERQKDSLINQSTNRFLTRPNCPGLVKNGEISPAAAHIGLRGGRGAWQGPALTLRGCRGPPKRPILLPIPGPIAGRGSVGYVNSLGLRYIAQPGHLPRQAIVIGQQGLFILGSDQLVRSWRVYRNMVRRPFDMPRGNRSRCRR